MLIEHLSRAELLEIAGLIAGAGELPRAMLERAIEAAEGVPLFLEQFIISLIEEQAQPPLRPHKPSGVPLLLAEMMSGRLTGARAHGELCRSQPALVGHSSRSFSPICCTRIHAKSPSCCRRWWKPRYCCHAGMGWKFDMNSGMRCCNGSHYESMLQSERRSTHQAVVEELRRLDESRQAPAEVMAYH